jgi:hypothetical protein
MTSRFSLQPGLPFVGATRLRGTLDFVAMDDHARLTERFLARHMAMDGLPSLSEAGSAPGEMPTHSSHLGNPAGGETRTSAREFSPRDFRK